MRTPHYTAMAFRADARRLAVSAPNGELTLWDTTVPERLQRSGRLQPARGIVAASWNPAVTSLLATISADGTCAAWWLPDDRPPECIVRWPTHAARPRHLGWVAAGRCVFTMTADGHAAVWDLRDSSAIGHTAASGGRPVVAAHHRGDQVVLVVDSGWARIWDPRTEPGEWIRLTDAPVSACAWTGKLLVVAGADGRVTCFDTSFRRVHEVRIDWLPVELVCSGGGILVARCADGRLIAADLDGAVRWEATLGAVSLGLAEDLVAVTTGRAVPGPTLLALATGRKSSAG